jgi:hypothetical protein
MIALKQWPPLLKEWQSQPMNTKWHQFRFWCPYGIWTCADGREVLFNRNYIAIWERSPGAAARIANHSEWVPWVTQDWFFNDWTSPVSDSALVAQWRPPLKAVNTVLRAWGLEALQRPRPPSWGRRRV